MLKGQGTIFNVIKCKNNDEWLAQRRLGIGGSDVAALVGASPWISPTSLYLEKIGQPLPNDLDESGPVNFGNDFEDTVRKKFAETHPDLIVRKVNAILQNKNKPWLQVSLDGEVYENKEWGILEIKCPGSVAKWNDGIPPHYIAQAMYYMHNTKRKFCWFAVFFRDTCEYKWYRIDYDPDMGQALEDAANNFWLNHVQKQIPPTATFGAPDEAAALTQLHAKPSANFLHAEDDVNIADIVSAWEKAKADEDAASKEKTRLANYLMQLIGDNKGLILSNARLTWVRGTTSTLDKRKLKLLYPNAIDECTDTKPRNMGLRLKKLS